MEGIMNFLEQYWGYTLFGGVSLGTIVTFAVVQIKMLMKNKDRDSAHSLTVNLLLEKLSETADNLNKSEEARAKGIEREEYLERVIATNFKALSYITMSSKLPTEEKIALQNDFAKLSESKKVEGKEIVKNTVDKLKDTAVDVKENVIDMVLDSVEQSETLLSKYTGAK